MEMWQWRVHVRKGITTATRRRVTEDGMRTVDFPVLGYRW